MAAPHSQSEPSSICLLRLSALGDVTHVLPVVHALRLRFPNAKLTWVIGKLEQKLLEGLSDIEWIVVDRKRPLAEWRRLRRELAGRRFDVLLHMQLALRAGVIASAISAQRRIGYPRSLHKELHGWLVNECIALPIPGPSTEPIRGPSTEPIPGPSSGPRAGPNVGHVVDMLMGFAAHLGAHSQPEHWPLVIPDAAHEFRLKHLGAHCNYAVISACSSHPLRNWHVEGYAAVADALAERGLRVVLVGGRNALELSMGQAIVQACKHPPLDLIGQDTLKELLAVLAKARVLITPDSGPAHFASALGTPVVALHAATDAQRSGPYRFRNCSVNAYPRAAQQFLRRAAASLRWGKKIELPGVMQLITVSEVLACIDLALRLPRTS